MGHRLRRPVSPSDVATFLDANPVPAPPIELIGPDTRAASLAGLRGSPVFVFFGYTHCTDVCPATVGTIGEAMAAAGLDSRAIFVTVDPARDTPAWLGQYVRYLPSGFLALTGTEGEIRATADAWSVEYAKEETDDPAVYEMTHTSDVRLVDASGMLRATFPYGTTADAMAQVLRAVVATTATPSPDTASGVTAPTPATTPTTIPTSAPPGALSVDVVSTSVWSGPASPVILTLSDASGAVADTTIRPMVQLLTPDGDPVGIPVVAVAVQPTGVATVSYVAAPTIPGPGRWRLAVDVATTSGPHHGTVDVTVLDPGTTAAIGSAAPTAHTPTLADVGDVARAITTDPAPDLRLSSRSTTDALADHQPFVLVIDSTKFRVSPACGRAIVMARYLLDRWPDDGFIHLEPYRYSVITDTPVLDGTIDDPTLTDAAAAWGIGGAPWGARSMPWVFVVDGQGVVRAKYQGVVGSADVDVILSLIAQHG